MTKFLLLLTLIGLHLKAAAQDFPFDTSSQQELDMKYYDKDSSAHAVILNEFGRISFNDRFQEILIHQYHVKIKILNGDALKYGDINIPFYQWDKSRKEEVKNFQAVVFYKDAAGKAQKITLTQSGGRYTELDKNHGLFSYALPKVTQGCIVEYKYQLETPHSEDFTPWLFQREIPKAYSQYQVTVPIIFELRARLTGLKKLIKNEAQENTQCYCNDTLSRYCTTLTYAMADVPAFAEEYKMPNQLNVLSAIYFNLPELTIGSGTTKLPYPRNIESWQDIEYLLNNDESFGKQLQKYSSLKKLIPDSIIKQPDSILKAKAIYHFIANKLKWNKNYSFVSITGIQNTLKTKTGNCGDINITLIAALNAAGFDALPVLTTTKEVRIGFDGIPSLADFNYVVAHLKINNRNYFLDATDPLMPFGMLPLSCLNSQGRVISAKDSSYWIDIKPFQKRSSTYSLDLTLQNDGKLSGKITKYSVSFDAYEARKEIKKFNTIDEYVEDLDERLSKIKITSSDIVAMNDLDNSLSETYEVEIDTRNQSNNDELSFNPFILDRLVENPFKPLKRNYPVDWELPTENRYMLTLHLPEQYAIKSIPKNTELTLPNYNALLKASFANESNVFTLSYAILFKDHEYPADDYPYIKELFNKINQIQKTDIIIQKIK